MTFGTWRRSANERDATHACAYALLQVTFPEARYALLTSTSGTFNPSSYSDAAQGWYVAMCKRAHASTWDCGI